MYMSNIPRRKIYETLLEFEGKLLEIEILVQNEVSFEKNKSIYGKEEHFEEMKSSYERIKCLMVLFLENKQFEKEEDFEKDLDYYLRNEEEVNNILRKDKNISSEFKKILSELDELFSNIKFIENIELGLKTIAIADKFDTMVPKFLELRRDKMKK